MKIEFIYSNLYEENLNHQRKKVALDVAQKAKEVMETYWNISAMAIEKTLEKVTGLKFKEERIECYLNSQASFSSPLSLKIESHEDMRSNLIHELIHVLMSQNYSSIKKNIEKFHRDYSQYPFITRIHILVHAIHFMFQKEIDPSKIKRIMEYSTDPDYRIAWEVVRQEGAYSIINKVLREK